MMQGHTDITADAVKPVLTVRLAVMNLEWSVHKTNSLARIQTYISVFLLSSPVVFFKSLVT